MNLGKYIAEILLERDKQTIALFPGAFKPPHKGHFKVVEQLLDKADQVVVLVSPNIRDGISAEESVAVWELYKTKLDGPLEIKITEGSPVREVYDVVKNNMGTDFLLAFGKEEGDRFGNSVKYPNAKVFDAGNFEGVNATMLRSAIKDDNEEEIAKYLPDGISVEEFLDAINKPHKEASTDAVPPPPNEPSGFPPFPGETPTPPEQPLQESPPINFEQDDYQNYVLQNRHKIEKAARVFNLPIADMEYAFNGGREVVLSDEMWDNLQNSKSYKMKSLDEAIQHALKLGIEPKPYIEAIKKGDDLPLPLVLCYAPNKYYLVGGEVILSIYRALGSIPTVLQGTLNLKIKENFYSEPIQESIKYDIKEFGMLPEYKIDMNDVYDYKNDNGFYTFYDDVNKNQVIVKLKQHRDEVEFKFYPIDEDGKVLGFGKLKHYNPKVMNTVFKIFLDDILPNHNKIIIQPAGYTRYRLFRALINKNLSKDKYDILVKDNRDQPLISITKKTNLSENKQHTKLSPEQVKTIKTFLAFTAKELRLNKIPSGLTLSHDNSKAKGDHTFGYFNPETDKIWLYVGNRNMADILRTLGHELVHLKQNEEGRIKADSGKTGSEIENEANAKAGVLLRNFGKQHNEIYESKLVPLRQQQRKDTNIERMNKIIQDYIDGGSKGNLSLNSTPITSLPPNLKVGGGLDLSSTPITSLPQDLKVEGNLYLYNTPITSLPQGLEVEGSLYLSITPLSKTHTEEQIKQMCPGVKGEIYL